MKKLSLLLALAITVIMSCTKTTTNNYGSGQPPFIVNGITNLSLNNGSLASAALYLDVQYTDSSQQNVTLSLSTLPAGITIDTAWTTSGIPGFSTTLTFYDTTAAQATPGTYSITLTAASASSKKTYTFNLTVVAAPPCTMGLVHKYIDCMSFCTGGGSYVDSVYADPATVNKIWFTNFNNSGNHVYGTYNCSNGSITIPSQTVGGIIYAGTGFGGSGEISISLTSPAICQFTDEL